MPTHERQAKQRVRTLEAAQSRALLVVERLVWACFELDASVASVAIGLHSTKDLDVGVHVEATFSERQPTDLNPAVEALKRALRTTHRHSAVLLFDFDGRKFGGNRYTRSVHASLRRPYPRCVPRCLRPRTMLLCRIRLLTWM